MGILGALLISGLLASQTQPTTASCDSVVALQSNSASDARARLARVLALSGDTQASRSFIFRPSVTTAELCVDRMRGLERWINPRPRAVPLRLAAIRTGGTYNSAYPFTRNDESLWSGVGVNTLATVQVQGTWKRLSWVTAPVVTYQQNLDYIVAEATWPGYSRFAHPDHFRIDYPKRFGNEGFVDWSLGQTTLQLQTGPIAAAVSTENIWVGPAQVYPLLFSNTAPGFPHFRLATTHPVRVGPFDFEAQVVMGSVVESDYFDQAPENNDHFVGVTTLAVHPRFLPGLWLGVSRVLHDSLSVKGQGLGFYFDRIVERSFLYEGGGNRASGNGIGALFMRWAHPTVGFEVYVEWAREDTPYNLQDVVREPDWSQAYMLGLQQVYRRPTRTHRMYGELIHLGESAPVRAGKGFIPFYTHAHVRQGHTNRGQLLGAAIGPGSDAQIVGYESYAANSRWSAAVERTRSDDDTYYRVWARRFGEARHDVELALQVEYERHFSNIGVSLRSRLARRYDRDFAALRELTETLAETNLHCAIQIEWRPRQ